VKNVGSEGTAVAIFTGANRTGLAIQGVLAIIFGLLVALYPSITFAILRLIIGVFVLIWGILAVVRTFTQKPANRWALFVGGIVAIILALVILFAPDITETLAVYLIAAWAIIWGIVQIVHSFDARKVVGAWLVGAIVGIVSVIFGIVIVAWPGLTLMAIISLIGIYLVFFGLLEIIWALVSTETTSAA
jgi:uncharacterized membrane protein HdeD (DUF308 family)